MRPIPPRQQATLARRIAGGLSPCAAARASRLDEAAVRTLLGVASFQEMVESWAHILTLSPEARRRRLELLAQLVVEARLAEADYRTALLVKRELARNRDIVTRLAQRFEHLAMRGMARQATPAPPTGPLSPVAEAVAEAETARRLAKRPDPDDRAMWRKAGQLRREIFDEQVLHHADGGEPPAAAAAVEPAPKPEPVLARNRAERRQLARLAKRSGKTERAHGSSDGGGPKAGPSGGWPRAP